MKEKKPYVVLEILKEGKKETITVSTEDLRKTLEKAKSKKITNAIELTFECENEKFQIHLNISDLRRIVKQSEMCTNFVPNTLSNYLVDLTQNFVQKPIMPIIGRENEIEKIWFYLSQKVRNNVFLIGPVEVGKTAIGYEVARQISSNECPKEFYNSRVLMLRPEMMLKIRSDIVYENVIRKVMNFLIKNRKNVVLYIDNALYMKTDEMLIRMLYSCIMKINIPLIMTSSEGDFEKYFLNDPSISKYVNSIYVEEPELYEIQPMIQNHILKLQNRYKVKISDEMIKFGIYTSSLSNSVSANPGNVINVLEKSFLEARRKGKKCVDKESILSCYDSYLKLYNNSSEDEKRSVSYHETGHYIITKKCSFIKNQKIAFVSILPMMDFLGVNWGYTVLGKTLNYTREYFVDNIAIYLGGRIGEKLFTGKDSTGASSDLNEATELARDMIMYYGLSKEESNKNRSYISEYGVSNYLISDKKKELFDKEIQGIINEANEIAEKLIKENEGLIKVISERLLVDEILTGEQLEQICKDYEQNNK